MQTLIIMNVFVAVVVFTGLPHPPSEENMAQTFVQDITVLSGKERASQTSHLSSLLKAMVVGAARNITAKT